MTCDFCGTVPVVAALNSAPIRAFLVPDPAEKTEPLLGASFDARCARGALRLRPLGSRAG